jgi:hypothetical protein
MNWPTAAALGLTLGLVMALPTADGNAGASIDRSIDTDNSKIDLRVRYPGDREALRGVRGRPYVEHCEWSVEGWWWILPYRPTQRCVRIPVR